VIESDADGNSSEARLLPRKREALLLGGMLKYLREKESPSRSPALSVQPRGGRRRAVHLQRLRIRRRLPGSPRRLPPGLERPDGDGGVTRTGPLLGLCLLTRMKNGGPLGVGLRAQRCPDMLRAVDVSP
jgi:hypothetical protein